MATCWICQASRGRAAAGVGQRWLLAVVSNDLCDAKARMVVFRMSMSSFKSGAKLKDLHLLYSLHLRPWGCSQSVQFVWLQARTHQPLLAAPANGNAVSILSAQVGSSNRATGGMMTLQHAC